MSAGCKEYKLDLISDDYIASRETEYGNTWERIIDERSVAEEEIFLRYYHVALVIIIHRF